MSQILSKLSFILAILLVSNVNAKIISYDKVPSGTYKLDKTHASIVWQVSHLGLSDYTARFSNFDATIKFDVKDPKSSIVEAEIDSFSIKTEYPYPEQKDFDKKLQGGSWFDSKKFPKIIFKSKRIELINDKNGVMVGNLTFLGVTKEVKLDIVFNGAMTRQPFTKKPTMGFKATAIIKRSDWGMKTYIPKIGDEVKIVFDGEFGMED